MSTAGLTSRMVRRACALAGVALAAAGCAAADKTATSSVTPISGGKAASSGGSSGSMAMGGSGSMAMGASGSMAMGGSASAPSTGSMASREMSASSISADGIKPVPMQVLGKADWQGMRIIAELMTPLPFVIYNGTSEQLVKPGHASFHLMVYLNDAHTGVPIPYASVWATISKGNRVVYDERQWPMISEYMGPHYGNDATVPGAGTYRLSLLISPPVSARHVEYQHVWLAPHRVSMTFHWTPPR